MKKLSLMMAAAALVLAGCGGRDEGVSLQTNQQAVQETAAEVEMVVVESQPPASADTAETAIEAVTAEVMDPATDTGVVVAEQLTQEVAVAAAPVQEAAAAGPDLAQGKAVYSKRCLACHGTGAAGAPKMGDSENWAPRIAQGLDTMAEHAIGGFRGATGYMPPRGGFMALSDADVTAAVAYMVSESR